MDYLSRILTELTGTDEPETGLPQLNETVSFAASRQQDREKQVSPTEETVSAVSAELATAFAALEEAARRQASASVTERNTAPEHAQSASQMQTADAERSFGWTEELGQPLPTADAEELSRIFQRDARRYG